MKPIYFTRAGTYKVAIAAPFLTITEEDILSKKRFYIDERYAEMTVEQGAAKYYSVEDIVKEETSKPLWQQYLERQGANTNAEKEYLSDICVKLGIPAGEVAGYKRKDFRDALNSAKPEILEGVVAGNIDLTIQKTPDEVVADIMNGDFEDSDSYEDILNGEGE